MPTTPKDVERAKRKFASRKQQSVEEILINIAKNATLQASLRDHDQFLLESKINSSGRIAGY